MAVASLPSMRAGLFEGYDTGNFYDEMFVAPSQPRARTPMKRSAWPGACGAAQRLSVDVCVRPALDDARNEQLSESTAGAAAPPPMLQRPLQPAQQQQ